jgi:hypothetical protein
VPVQVRPSVPSNKRLKKVINMTENALNIAKNQLSIWAKTLTAGESQTVADLYLEDATLKPTLDPQHKHNRADIKSYFDHFLPKGPKCTLLEDGNLRATFLSETLILFTGKYEFCLEKQNNDVVLADFVFIYKLDLGTNTWSILKHSSSLSL